MAAFLEGIIGVLELFKPYIKTIVANWYLFLLWTLAEWAIISAFYKKRDAKRQETIKAQKKENKKLRKLFDKLNAASWLGAPQVKPEGDAAEAISSAMKKKHK